MITDTWQGCTPDGRPPKVGVVYRINSSRKGTFEGKCLSADENTWAEFEITTGIADAIMSYNVRGQGEKTTVRSSLCRMTPIAAAKLACSPAEPDGERGGSK